MGLLQTVRRVDVTELMRDRLEYGKPESGVQLLGGSWG